MKRFFSLADQAIYRVLKALALSCMVLLLVILVLNVFFRVVPILSLFPSFSMGWFDEIIEILFAWMIFSTASILTRSREHFRVDLIQTKLGESRWNHLLELAIELASLAFLAIFAYYSWKLTMGGVQTSPVLRLEKKWFYLCMPINFTMMFLYTLRDLIGHAQSLFKKPALISE